MDSYSKIKLKRCELMENTHTLKILPEYFEAVISGNKTFEIRKNDRNFMVNEIVILKEFNNGSYTGRFVEAQISYITNFEQKENIVVFGINVYKHQLNYQY